MRFSCEDISAAARLCAQVAGKAYSPIMGAVRVTASDNSVNLLACGNGVWVSATVPAAVHDAGSACVDAADFSRAALGSFSASASENSMSIDAIGKFKIPLIAGDIADAPGSDDAAEIVDGCAAFHKVVGFSDMSHHQEMCHGVGFLGGMAIAGDGVSYAGVEVDGANGQIVPANAARAIPKDGRLFVGEATWRAESEGLTASGPLIERRFADVSSQIGGGASFGNVDADQLRAAIDSASLGRSSEVVLEFCGNELTVTGSRFSGVSADTSVSISMDGATGVSVFSTRQISKVAAHLSGSVIDISCNGRMVKFSAIGGNDFAVLGVMRDARNVIPGGVDD